jgi:hypothetical protein
MSCISSFERFAKLAGFLLLLLLLVGPPIVFALLANRRILSVGGDLWSCLKKMDNLLSVKDGLGED